MFPFSGLFTNSKQRYIEGTQIMLRNKLVPGGGGNIVYKMVGTCHSTDKNEPQKSRFLTEKVDSKSGDIRC